MNILAKIQAALKVPKSQRNDFGKYNFRSAEDILEAVKPLANVDGYFVSCTDTLVLIGNRYYVEAIASLSNGSEIFSAKSYAREEETLKGMQSAQITGSASSYARKYALNGLFAIDDTKDDDFNNKGEKAEVKTPHTPMKNPKPAISGEISKQRPLTVLDELTPTHKAWNYVTDRIKAGVPLDKIKESFKLSPENEEKLIKAASLVITEQIANK